MLTNHTISQKYDLIQNNGKYIGVRSYYNYTINLYVLDDVFYELWYFRPTNKIEKIEKLVDEKTLNLLEEDISRFKRGRLIRGTMVFVLFMKIRCNSRKLLFMIDIQ